MCNCPLVSGKHCSCFSHPLPLTLIVCPLPPSTMVPNPWRERERDIEVLLRTKDATVSYSLHLDCWWVSVLITIYSRKDTSLLRSDSAYCFCPLSGRIGYLRWLTGPSLGLSTFLELAESSLGQRTVRRRRRKKMESTGPFQVIPVLLKVWELKVKFLLQ